MDSPLEGIRTLGPTRRLTLLQITPVRPMVGYGCPMSIAPPPRNRQFADLYGAFPVKRLFLGFAASSLFGAGKAVLRPVACDQVRGARGRGRGTETLAKLGGFAA